jgi:hypothetical protein
MPSKEKYVNPFIIESRTQGVFMGWDLGTPRFSVKAKRNEGRRYSSFAEARVDLFVLMKLPRGRKAYVHKLGSRMNVWQPSLEGGNNR